MENARKDKIQFVTNLYDCVKLFSLKIHDANNTETYFSESIKHRNY